MEKSLKEIWNIYFCVSRNLGHQNETLKSKLIELFIRRYYASDDPQNDESGLVVTSVASDLCYFLLLHMEKVVREAIPLEIDISGFYGDGEDLEAIRTKIIDDAKTSAYKNFLLQGLGGRILKLMSDIDLRFITTRRELCHILISTFPSVRWETEPKNYLEKINPNEIQEIFRTMSILFECSPKQSHELSRKESINRWKPTQKNQQIDIDESELSEDFEKITQNTSSLAEIIIQILLKLLDCEKRTQLRFYDNESVTLSCLDYSLRNLKRLNKENIFGSDDQFVIRMKILKVLYQSLNNWLSINFSSDRVLSTFLQLIGIGDDTEDITVLCGILVALLATLNNVIVKAVENTKDFLAIFRDSYVIVVNMFARIANGDPELLYRPQRLLIRLIRNLNLVDLPLKSRRRQKKNRRKKQKSDFLNQHCDLGRNKSTCIFEKMLLETLAMTDNPKNNRMLLKHFHQNKICCCNATVQTVEVILNLNVLHNYCLHLIKKQILLPMFSAKELCKKCALKQNSQDFERGLFEILKNTINLSSDSQLNLLLYHIFKIGEILPYHYCNTILSIIVLPLFWREKQKFLENPEENSKELLVTCLNIILVCIKDIRTIKMLFNSEMIKHIRDLSMIPELSKSCCSLLKIGIENSGILGEHEGENEPLVNLIMEIPCSNILYLIDELGEIFSRLKLKRNFSKIEKHLNDQKSGERFKDEPISFRKLIESVEEDLNMNQKRLDKEDEALPGTSKSALIDMEAEKRKFHPKSTSSPRKHNDLEEFEILEEIPIVLNENSSLEKLLFLCSTYFELIAKLLVNSSKFREEFRDQIQLTYKEDFLFNLFYNSVEAILITNELENQKSIKVPVNICFGHFSVENLASTREYHSKSFSNEPVNVLVGQYDLNYAEIMKFYNQKNFTGFSHSLTSPRDELPLSEVKPQKDDDLIDPLKIFKVNQVSVDPKRRYSESEFFSMFSISDKHSVSSHLQTSDDQNTTIYRRILNNLFMEKQVISDKLYELFMKFVNFKSDESDDHRLALIRELHGDDCLKSLFSIAASSLEILFKSNENVSDCEMKSALCELKSLLLQNSENYWESMECGNTILNTLLLLIKVAEAKKVTNNLMSSGINSPSLIMLENISINQKDNSYIEPLQNGNSDNIFSDVESCEGEVLEMIGMKEDTDEDQTTEENYMTADDSYDADEEFFSYSETESSCNQDNLPMFCSQTSIHFLMSNNINQNICQLVVEILMELSKKCINDKNFWVENLRKLSKRLSNLRNFLGGSTFLLKGFFPVLKLNDPELIELQLAILDLVNDLDTPESYAAFLSILATENPPIDLLLPRFTSICQMQVKPFVEIDFPTIGSEEFFTTNCTEEFLQTFRELMKIQRNQETSSPITESSMICPLDQLDLQVWNASGFTVSTWLQMKSEFNDSKMMDQEMRVSESKIHLFSVGSEKLMISIYLNSDRTISLNVFVPEEEHQEKPKKKSKFAELINSTASKKSRKLVSADNEFIEKNNKENVDNSNFFGIALATLKSPGSPKVYTRGFLKNREKVKSSKDVKKYEKPICLIRNPWKTKQLKLQCGKWTHLTVSVKNTTSHIVVLFTIDGLEQEIMELPLSISKDLEKWQKIQMLCIGSTTADPISPESLQYSISNINFLKSYISTPTLLANLHALGPDCDNLNLCQTENLIFNYGLLALHKNVSGKIEMSNSVGQLSKLRRLLKLTYSARQPETVLGYKNEFGEKLETLLLGNPPITLEVPSIYRTIILSGGLSSLLFLFARIVELTDNPTMQSSALYVFLKVAHSNNELYKEFQEKRMFSLVAHVFKSKQCTRGPEILKVIMDVACGVSLINRSENLHQIVGSTNLCILHPQLVFAVLEHYFIFDPENPHILDLYLGSLFLMISKCHQNYQLNLDCLIDHNFLDQLLLFCEVNLTDTNNTIAIGKVTATSITALIKALVRNPYDLEFLKKLIKLVLLLHPSNESFVTHDRSKFFFILPPNKPTKSKRLLPSFNRKLRRARKDEKYQKRFHYIEPFNDEKMEQFQRVQRQLSTDDDGPVSPTARSSKTSICLSGNKKIRKLDELNEKERSLVDQAFTRKSVREKLMKTPGRKNKTPSRITRKSETFRRRLSLTNLNPKISPKRLEDPEELDGHIVKQFENMMLKNADGLDRSPSSEILDIISTNKMAGSYLLQENFIQMICESLVSMSDISTENLLENHLKLEILIVMANHSDSSVRAAIIRLIKVVLERTGPDKRAKYTKLHYWIHLGNQLTIYPVSLEMVQACMEWIGRGCTSLEKLKNLDAETIQKEGLVPLVAMLPHVVNDHHLFPLTLKYLRFLIERSQESFLYMLENGLVTSSIKALINLSNPHEKCMQSVYKLLKMVAFKSLTSTGSINKLWDLLYGLTYEEKLKKSQKIREAHIFLLNFLLKSLIQQNTPSRRFPSRASLNVNTNLENCNLQASEIKTRFNLIYERAIQFIISSEPRENLTENEMELVELIVSLTLCGFTQGSSILLWGLAPMKPVELKILIIRQLWNLIKDGSSLQIEIEQKYIKSLSLTFLQSHRDKLDAEDATAIEKFCENFASSSIQLNILVSQAMEKMETLRLASSKEQDVVIDRSIYKHENLVQNCIEVAMKMTREVMDIQNQERRILIGYIKKLQEMDFHRDWVELIQRMTHEGAPWHNPNLYSNCWEVDPTEGPDKCRRRLRRTTLKIEKRFFLEQFAYKADFQAKKPLLSYIQEPDENDKYSIRDQIIFNFSGKYLTMDQEIDGDIIITDTQLLFLASEDVYNNSIICRISEISEIWERRYQHKEIAVEFFLVSARSFLLILESNYDRELIKQFFAERVETSSEYQKMDSLVQQWRDGNKTNFEYLMELNKLAGRSYNDLMQYPVFPWILANYDGSMLDLQKEENFRKLEKTIGTQHKDSENHYVENYKYLEQSLQEHPQGIMKPYHYSSHYSNSGTVLHFLVRVPPYTSMFLLYQDHNFDLPDRTFHALSTTYKLASKDSATDVKELVPEFFFFPEMLENIEGFNFGKKQNGVQVNDVLLPEWSSRNARLFTMIHRQALESDIVRKKLNSWIDLVFGFKQKGMAAVGAVNVFHPATYQEFQVTTVSDTVERQAYETMIRTYGQMPKQIFVNPSPKSKSASLKGPVYEDEFSHVLRNVRGLRWGNYTGSPQLATPKLVDFHQKINTKIDHLVSITENNLFHGLPSKCALMQRTRDTLNLVLWGLSDNLVRIKSLNDENKSAVCLFHVSPVDPITSCGSHYRHKNLWFGYKSGKISVFTRRCNNKGTIKDVQPKGTYNSKLESIIGIKDIKNIAPENDGFEESWNSSIILIRHSGKVLDIKISVEFNIVVSIGSDKRTVIWDANRIEYVRTIEPPCNTLDSRLSLVAVSPTLGDIVTIFTPINETTESSSFSSSESFEITENNTDDFLNINMKVEKSQLRLHTINAKYVSHRFAEDKMSSVCYSAIKEGTGVNAIAVGFKSGTVRFYSSWNLDPIREITVGTATIECLLFTTHHHLVVLANGNLIQVFESESDEISGKLPKFNNIVPIV